MAFIIIYFLILFIYCAHNISKHNTYVDEYNRDLTFKKQKQEDAEVYKFKKEGYEFFAVEKYMSNKTHDCYRHSKVNTGLYRSERAGEPHWRHVERITNFDKSYFFNASNINEHISDIKRRGIKPMTSN